MHRLSGAKHHGDAQTNSHRHLRLLDEAGEPDHTKRQLSARPDRSVTPIASAGSDPDAIRQDLRAMILAANLKADSKPYWIFSVPLATALSLMQSAVSSETKTFSPLGGTWMTFTALVSDALDDDQAMLIDAARIAGDTGPITLDTARHASLQMNDARRLCSLQSALT
jgi:hypothetical protein